MRLMSSPLIAVVGLALAIGGVHGAATENERAEVALDRAVALTLKQSVLRSERRAQPDRGHGTLVEEFIAPHRVRSLLPPSQLEGFPDETTLVIGIGRRVYYQDVLAKPPKDQLFVTCVQKLLVAPEVFSELSLIADADDVTRVVGSEGHFAFRLNVKTKVLKEALDGAKGEAVVTGGRVVEFRVNARNAKGSDLIWTLRFNGVPPIKAPPADQIDQRKGSCSRS
jgi:hypothetical protein